MTGQQFEDVVKTRRSANNFDPAVQITREELEEMFALTKLAPSAYNLQHAHYVVVDDQTLKLQVKEAAYRQHKVETASAAIVVLGDTQAYTDAERIYEGMVKLGMMDEQGYKQLIESIYAAYENKEFQKEEAIRNASLSAMQFMLIAKSKGWDTCPMIGFDAQKLTDVLHIPERFIPVLMITIGKEKTNHPRPRGYRKPTGEFVHFGAFL
ncbi:nitroreductase family protein [Aneurinibacillus sp. BA2021]|nr:nitroreductase family protein [Aneurinibacillus sp. BA2021]